MKRDGIIKLIEQYKKILQVLNAGIYEVDSGQTRKYEPQYSEFVSQRNTLKMVVDDLEMLIK